MRHSGVFIVCVLSLIAYVQAAIVYKGYLGYNGQAVTSRGDGNQVYLAPLGTCDRTQEWVYDSDGHIYQTSNTTQILDVQNSDVRNGALVIMWIRKSPPAPNQLWNVSSTGVSTQLNGFYLRKSSTSQNVVSSNNVPVQQFGFFPLPSGCQATCTSHGDPHFHAFTGRRFDFQFYGTVLLANWSNNLIFTNQFPCAPGVTCNEGIVIQPAGTTQTFQLTGTTMAFYNKTMVNVTMGNTTFGIFTVTKSSRTAFTIVFPGAVVTYAAYWWRYGWYINIGLRISPLTGLGRSLCTGPAASDNVHTFGVSLAVTSASQTAYQYVGYPFTYDPNYVPNYGPYNTTDTALMTRAMNACASLMDPAGPLRACFGFVAPDFYYGTCYNDSIVTGDLTFAQMAIDAYVFQCQEAAKQNGTTITLPTTSVTTTIVGASYSVAASSTTMFTIVARDINNVMRMTGGDSFTITSMGPGMLTFTIVDNNNGTYTVSYTPTVEGVYMISVKLNNGSDIADSPFNVTVFAVTSATTTGLVLGPVPTNTSQSFTIQARTSSGANRLMGGDSFTVSFSDSSLTLEAIVDNMDGTYTIRYRAFMAGYYTIGVSYMGMPIACSPYTVIVKNMMMMPMM